MAEYLFAVSDWERLNELADNGWLNLPQAFYKDPLHIEPNPPITPLYLRIEAENLSDQIHPSYLKCWDGQKWEYVEDVPYPTQFPTRPQNSQYYKSNP